MSKGINTFNDIDNDTVNDIYRRKSYRELTFTDDYIFCRILADDPELQALRKPEIPRRSRYYQSVSDIDHLDKGMKYGALPDMYVIFICMFDPFGEGLARYEFRNLCMEGSRLELGDGTCKIFINARSKRNDVPPELKSLMDYLCGKEPCSRPGLPYSNSERDGIIILTICPIVKHTAMQVRMKDFSFRISISNANMRVSVLLYN